MAKESTSQIIDVLSRKLEQAQNNDFYALLDLEESATEDEIKRAYFRVARMVHPDTIQKQALGDRKEDAAFIFEKVTEAFQTLSNPSRRTAYLKGRGGAPGAPVAPKAASKLQEEQAKIALHHGKMLLNRRSYSQAEAHFREYTELKPDDARGFLFLGWSLFQNTERPLDARLEDARAAFTQAIKLDDESADAHYYLSLYHKEKGEYDKVEKHLKKALEIKKDHVPALREQRLLQMRAGASKPTQPTIGEFFKDLWSKLNKKR